MSKSQGKGGYITFFASRWGETFGRDPVPHIEKGEGRIVQDKRKKALIVPLLLARTLDTI